MSGVNKVIIVGRLGNDPEYKQFSNGGAVTRISVATSEKWRDNQGQMQEKTEWHRISLFNRGNYKLADIANQYLRKGSQVYIEGKLETNKWQDQNGQDRYSTEIKADQMQMLGDSNSGGASGGYQNQGQGGAPNQGGYQNQNQNQGNNFGGNDQNAQVGFQGNQPANNQNSFAQNESSNTNSNQPKPANNAFNNQISNDTAPMADTPRDDDIPF